MGLLNMLGSTNHLALERPPLALERGPRLLGMPSLLEDILVPRHGGGSLSRGKRCDVDEQKNKVICA